MKKETLQKLKKLAIKDHRILALLITYTCLEKKVSEGNVEDIDLEEKNIFMIDLLKKQKQNDFIKEAIKLLEEDSKNIDNNNITIKINCDVNGNSFSISKTISKFIYNNLKCPNCFVDEIINEVRKNINKNIKEN